MALALIIGLYALEILCMKLTADYVVDPAIESLLAIAALFLPIVIYSAIDRRLTSAAADQIGRAWCATNSAEFVHTLEHKNHFSIVHKINGKTARQKCRLEFAFNSWRVKKIHWV